MSRIVLAIGSSSLDISRETIIGLANLIDQVGKLGIVIQENEPGKVSISFNVQPSAAAPVLVTEPAAQSMQPAPAAKATNEQKPPAKKARKPRPAPKPKDETETQPLAAKVEVAPPAAPTPPAPEAPKADEAKPAAPAAASPAKPFRKGMDLASYQQQNGGGAANQSVPPAVNAPIAHEIIRTPVVSRDPRHFTVPYRPTVDEMIGASDSIRDEGGPNAQLKARQYEVRLVHACSSLLNPGVGRLSDEEAQTLIRSIKERIADEDGPAKGVSKNTASVTAGTWIQQTLTWLSKQPQGRTPNWETAPRLGDPNANQRPRTSIRSTAATPKVAPASPVAPTTTLEEQLDANLAKSDPTPPVPAVAKPEPPAPQPARPVVPPTALAGTIKLDPKRGIDKRRKPAPAAKPEPATGTSVAAPAPIEAAPAAQPETSTINPLPPAEIPKVETAVLPTSESANASVAAQATTEEPTTVDTTAEPSKATPTQPSPEPTAKPQDETPMVKSQAATEPEQEVTAALEETAIAAATDPSFKHSAPQNGTLELATPIG